MFEKTPYAVIALSLFTVLVGIKNVQSVTSWNKNIRTNVNSNFFINFILLKISISHEAISAVLSSMNFDC
jgi:hypothetical protein